jgi:hypothetical protein
VRVCFWQPRLAPCSGRTTTFMYWERAM